MNKQLITIAWNDADDQFHSKDVGCVCVNERSGYRLCCRDEDGFCGPECDNLNDVKGFAVVYEGEMYVNPEELILDGGAVSYVSDYAINQLRGENTEKDDG